jgi:hypothetical protein
MGKLENLQYMKTKRISAYCWSNGNPDMHLAELPTPSKQELKMQTTKPTLAPPITPLEMTEREIELCERAARRIGFTQTAYTSSSGLWGLFCLPDHAKHRRGCFIKTREFGIMFLSDLEDLQLHDLAEDERKKQ